MHSSTMNAGSDARTAAMTCRFEKRRLPPSSNRKPCAAFCYSPDGQALRRSGRDHHAVDES